jgi:hypothetical protein
MSNQEKVLRILIRERDWLATYDFQNRHGIFVGHRAPARISEVALAHPDMIDTDTSDKTYKYRFKIEDTDKFLPTLPEDFRRAVEEELKGQKIPYYKIVREFQVIGDVAREVFTRKLVH